jgi:ATP-dependent protease HslVU (ClpYQ) peptidase subunit
VRGVIYPIFSDYSWDREVRNIYYGGSGGDVALGAMVALGIQKMADKPEQAAKVVHTAVATAAAWDVYTSAPIITEIQYGKKK